MMRCSMIAVSLALAACSPMGAEAGQPSPTSTAAARHPVSGLAVIPLSVASKGGRHTFRVELARTAQEQAQGLMFRTVMGADEGMLFLRNPADQASFWMRNTVIPLDLIFIGADRRVLNVAANAVPYDETPIISAGVAAAVLELNGGRAAELGIAAGDAVEW